MFVHGATLWLDCTIHSEIPACDHDIVSFHIRRLRTDLSATPLVFHGSRFRRLASI